MAAFVLRSGKYNGAARGSGDEVPRLQPFPELDIPLAAIWPEEDELLQE